MTIRVAVIGAGRIGWVHAHNASAHPSSDVVMVVDPDVSAAQRLAATIGARVASADEVMSDHSIAAVIVATPGPTHPDLVEMAAFAGKAVFCEKPLALDLERTRLCVARVAKAGVPLLVGFNRRFDPHLRRLDARIEAGEIGAVELVTIISKDPEAPPRTYLATSGGLFRDMTIHDFDMARHLLGEEPVRVSALAAALTSEDVRALGDVDTAAVTLQTASGKIAVITNSRRASFGYDQRIEVHGSKGKVAMDNVPPFNVSMTDSSGSHAEPPRDFFAIRYSEAYRAEWHHFVDVVQNGVEPEATGYDGERALTLADAALESLRSSASVEVPPLDAPRATS